MPASAALKRLVDYYQSQQFADDLVRQVGQNPAKAKIYRQHIVDLLNTSLRSEGIAISGAMIQEQEDFVGGSMSDLDLVIQARLYALKWTSGINHE